MFYLNYLKEVPSEAFMFIKYRKTQQKDKCFTNTFGPKLLWMARNCHLGGVSTRMAGTVRGEGTYAADRKWDCLSGCVLQCVTG